MAKLINGKGNPAVYAAEDADLIASIMGDKTSICNLGSKFAATASGANVIEVADGVIITKEGRRIQLDSGLVDEFSIPAGTVGTTNYYIIGYKLYENAQVQQVCETFVQLMPNSTDVIQEDTFKGGATEVYVSLYRVEQDGVNLGTITALLPEIGNISEINDDLSDKVERMSGISGYQTVDVLGYNPTTKKLGLKVNGADTVIPFSSASTIVAVTHTTTNTVGEVGYIYPNLIKFESNKTTGTYWTCPMTGVVTQTIFDGLVYVNSHGGNQQWWCEYTFNKPVIKLEQGTLSYINANTATRTDIRNRVMFIVQ